MRVSGEHTVVYEVGRKRNPAKSPLSFIAAFTTNTLQRTIQN